MLRSMLFAGPRTRADAHAEPDTPLRQDTGAAALAVVAMIAISAHTLSPPDADRHVLDAGPAAMAPAPSEASGAEDAAGSGGDGKVLRASREWAFGGYGGVSYTHPATVTIQDGERTDMTISDFEWMGMPFKAPIYYGLRLMRWGEGQLGTMVDFIHAKAIAVPDDVATFTGTVDGAPLPAQAPVKEIFRKLEFSHGHNMLMLNGLVRLTPSWMRVRPYLGVGGGITLPHTEIHLAAKNERTYEYQYAGLVGQGLAGLEIQLGRASVFVEYKFTYAPYEVPLSHRSPGWLLVTDLWDQLRDWWTGTKPPGGQLRVNLASHHLVGGVLIKPVSAVGTRP